VPFGSSRVTKPTPHGRSLKAREGLRCPRDKAAASRSIGESVWGDWTERCLLSFAWLHKATGQRLRRRAARSQPSARWQRLRRSRPANARRSRHGSGRLPGPDAEEVAANDVQHDDRTCLYLVTPNAGRFCGTGHDRLQPGFDCRPTKGPDRDRECGRGRRSSQRGAADQRPNPLSKVCSEKRFGHDEPAAITDRLSVIAPAARHASLILLSTAPMSKTFDALALVLPLSSDVYAGSKMMTFRFRFLMKAVTPAMSPSSLSLGVANWKKTAASVLRSGTDPPQNSGCCREVPTSGFPTSRPICR
jgi:hypothetical protein